jgi:predicted DNA-binding transcriptional regulator AlpA
MVSMEILTAGEVATLLKISKFHVYELTKEHTKSGNVRENPLPCIRFGKSVRFSKEAVEAWIERLSNANHVSHG